MNEQVDAVEAKGLCFGIKGCKNMDGCRKIGRQQHILSEIWYMSPRGRKIECNLQVDRISKVEHILNGRAVCCRWCFLEDFKDSEFVSESPRK